MTNKTANLWAIVLAAGDGVRLRGLMSQTYGYDVPKQYCTFNGDQPLVRMALKRAFMITTIRQTIAVVAADHRQWWEPQLTDLPRDNIVVQPCNRGTACGVLLPLIRVLLENPNAFVVVLPSDHFVDDERVFARTVCKAFKAARAADDSVVLLGIPPEGVDADYGWIEPTLSSRAGVHWVLSFVEKPVPELAAQLRERGYLWNSFVFVARGLVLLEAYSRAFPSLIERFGSVWVDSNADDIPRRLEDLYSGLPTLDLSRDVLQAGNLTMRVLPVPPCGWTDLGTPDRVARCVERCGAVTSKPQLLAANRTAVPDLAATITGVDERSTTDLSPQTP